jgi:hypothetical protein
MRTDVQPALAGNATRVPLTQERLKEILHYNHRIGTWHWLVTRNQNVLAGSVAGYVDRRGYRHITIDGRLYRSARLAFLYMLGRLPVEADHEDVNPGNECWKNLREANHSQNNANRRAGRLGRSLPKGVTRHRNKFRAQVCRDGRNIYLGIYDTPEEAAAAYAKAAAKVHGQFARAAA